MHTKLQTAVLILGVAVVSCSPAYACSPGNYPPVADLEAVPEYVSPDVNVTLEGSGSYDSDGSIVKYEWDWTSDSNYDYNETSGSAGDGAFDGNTVHAYSTAGTYTVTLRVTDDDSATDTGTCTVYVYKVHNITQDSLYNSIQAALDDANDSDIIEAAKGTYYENIDFNGVSCTLRSTDPNDFDVITATIIDGNDVNVVVAFNSNETSNTLLAGFTIINGTHGVSCSNSSSPVISKCLIYDNNSAGICSSSTTPPTVKNNWIYDNDKAIEFSSANSAATVRNNTIVDNTSYGIYVTSGNEPNIINCILWKNNDELSSCSATYSCIEDINDANGVGNISSYPYFTDYGANDFHLTWNSPCINRGDPNGTYSGEIDIDGDERVAEEEFIDERVDMGADEMNLHNMNLVQNPGFEGGNDTNGVPLYWVDQWASLSKSLDSCEPNVHSGNYSWKFVADGNQSSGAYSNFISVEPYKMYKLSAWIKSDSGDELILLGWEEFDANHGSFSPWEKGTTHFVIYRRTVPKEWTRFHGFYMPKNRNAAYVKLRFFGPKDPTAGTVWWDDFSLVEVGNEFLPPYGCANEPNVVETVEFGQIERNINWVADINVMSNPSTDSNDSNISYRRLLTGKTLTVEFPVFNVDPNDYNCPQTPMLLEIGFKDTTDNYVSPTDIIATEEDLVIVKSKIDYVNLDPNYLYDPTKDPNDRDYYLAHLGGRDDNEWKYIQYGFTKSDYQLLRAINGKFTIKITNNSDANIAIDYISLRKVTETEYELLTEKQRRLRGFYEANLPADAPDNPTYDDPNITIFVRDIMRPVYKHTKPGPNEPNSISIFSCWGQVEPASFSIYSENGVNDLTVDVNDLVHADGNTIDSNNISIYHVVYDKKRFVHYGPASFNTLKSYGLISDRLEEFASLSVDPNTSERIWLKLQVPDLNDGLPPGLYQGNAYIKQNGFLLKEIPIDFTIYNVSLEDPIHINPVWSDPFGYDMVYSEDLYVIFQAYRETGFDPFICSYSHQIHVEEDTNKPYNIAFDTNNFEISLDRMINEGFAKVIAWVNPSFSFGPIYKIVHGDSLDQDDPYLYYKLTDPNFTGAFGALVEKYIEVGNDRNIDFKFFIIDEPDNDPYKRIIADRLYTIIKDPNLVDPNISDSNYVPETTVTYYKSCDEDVNVSSIYNTPNDINIPPLTNLIDYKIWPLWGNQLGTGYLRHNDPNYYGHFGYYTTAESYLRNPIYNRFLHGLFAFGTDATVVNAYAMGQKINNPYNDFDGGYNCIFPFTFPDFLYAYPTWSGELLYTIGGLEGIREGIKDAKYIATLERLIEENPGNDANSAQEYLEGLKSSIDPNYTMAYSSQETELGYYKAILEDISDINDPNDFEAFTEIRKDIADYIMLLK